MPATKKIVLFALWAWFALTWIAPPWPLEQALHSSLTVLALLALPGLDRRWPLSTGQFTAVCGFIAVHCVGSRWLYSNVPYEAWLQWLFGWSPGEGLGWQRNHFDRLVHLLYGLLLTPALVQITRRAWPTLKRWHGFVLALMAVMCSSLVYEWMEWGIALAMSPEAAESYNGQQGDPWDAHADMLLATLGSLAAWPAIRRTVA